VNRPNVLLFIMDDQTSQTIGALGNPHISTPSLDALVGAGCWLRPYTTVPVCQPARAELLTGRNAFQNGCRWFGEPMDPEITLLPQALADAGYHCCHVGKWHNEGHPREKGYHETWRVFPNDLAEPYIGHWQAYRENGKIVIGHSTELFCEATTEFLHRATTTQPWFCYCALLSPHDPRTAPEPWKSMYDRRPPPLPPNYMPEHPFDNGDMMIRDERLAGFPRRQEEVLRHRADYYAMISHHDHSIGQVLHALDQTGQRDNTLVVFTSDHGLAVGCHGLMGKENLYEHSARVPLILQGPGIPVGKRCDECLCGHYDLMPTLMEYLGVEAPTTSQGLSYMPVLRGEIPTVRQTLCAAYRDCMRMARDGRFKMIYYPHIGRTQLFDTLSDPDETNDRMTSWRSHPESRCVPPSLSPTQQSCPPDPDPGRSAPPNNSFAGAHPVFNPAYEPAVRPAEVEAIIQRLRSTLAAWQEENNDPVRAS